MNTTNWKVNIHGHLGSNRWEIAVVRSDNKQGIESYGWFGPDKILVNHNIHPECALHEYVWNESVRIAEALCSRLNGQGD